MRVNIERSQIGRHVKPGQHLAKAGRGNREDAIGWPLSLAPQWPEKALVDLGQRVFPALRSLEPAHHQSALPPLDISPSQVREFTDAQPVVEGEPDRRGVASAGAVRSRGL